MVAVAFTVLLLVLATTSQGAFAISRWAPLALFVLAALFGALIGRRHFGRVSRPVLIALGGIWGLAGWSILSMLWAKSPANAFQAADRMILYAAIATLPFAFPASRRSLASAGWAISVGIGAIAVYVLIRLLIDGLPLFLAGRLNGPVNYRNATALLFALPFWPLVVAMATRSYRRGVRASAFAIATLCLGLAFLTQARGIVIGLVLGGIVTLSLGPDRVRRTWVAALSVVGVVAASPLLLKPYHAFSGGNGLVSEHDITVAAIGLALLTVIAFAVGLLLALFDRGLRADSEQMREVRQLSRVALGIGVVVVVIGALAATGNPVTYVHQKWDQFRNLNESTTSSSTRLLTTSGQRYDLWRVALKEFSSAPIQGVGGDNYSFAYYRQRMTNRNLNDPHSLIFGLLAEDGLVGTGLFLVFLGGIIAVLRRGWPRLAEFEKRHIVGPAAAGAVLLGQSLVDWIWLIPGLTAVGVFALAIAAAQVEAPGAQDAAPAEGEAAAAATSSEPAKQPPAERRSLPRRIARPAALIALLGSVVAVLALFLSDAYVQRARTLDTSPSAELSAARTASKLDPWSITPHYLESSAYESMGQRGAALKQLKDALSLEPQNSATLGVIGDFMVRANRIAVARHYYRLALALNPRDTGLQQLARIGEPVRHARRSHA